jgi:transposase InsO family protein
MSLARLVVAAIYVEGRNKSEVAREYKVSRRWVQKLAARYDAEGEAALQPRSRRPRSSPQQIARELEEEIVELRKSLAGEGLDAGAATIAFHLAARHDGRSPAVSTIWRVLTRRGFVTPQPGKRPRSSYVRFQADQPNERWQLDITRWQLADGSPAEILNIIDDHSRLLTASAARITFKAADVVTVFRAAAAAHGLPASMLSDNGAVFTGKPRGRGKVALEIELAALHITFRHSRAYHPQTCGKVERFHQTLKKWLARQPPAATLAELQVQLDWFTGYYNHQRPHRALARRTPAAAFAARPAAGPAGLAAAAHYRIRHDRVDDSGVITIRYNSRLHHIGLGRAHARTRVLALIADLDIRVINHDTGELIRALTLNPAKDYQPQPRKENDVPGHL